MDERGVVLRISAEHAARYQAYYAEHPTVSLPSRWLDRVEDLAIRHQARSVLDYGSGPSRGLSRFMTRPVLDYDPGVPGLDSPPERADLVVCIHTLEHVEAECLDDVLWHLVSLARRALFVVVSCEPSSSKVLPDGTPWHTFVRDAKWWRRYLHGFVEQPILKKPGAEYAALVVV